MKYNILAIDPGSKGFITFVNAETDEMTFHPIADGDMYSLASFIEQHKDNTKAVIEEVHAIFGSSAKATFSFGEINGYLKGLLTAFRIPYILVQPKKWQKNVWNTQDIVYEYKTNKKGETKKTINTKMTSYNAARRLFPNTDLRRTPKCSKFDDNKVDSLLISHYAHQIL